MMKVSVVIGLLLILASILLSIFGHFHFWYTPFLLGNILFFAALNRHNRFPSIADFVAKKDIAPLVIFYVIGILIALVVDIVYGRLLARWWVYPYLDGSWRYVVPILVYYPLGSLSVYEVFNFIAGTMGRPRKLLNKPHLNKKVGILLFVSVLVLFAPLLLFFSREYITLTFILFAVALIILSDIIAGLITHMPLLVTAINKDRGLFGVILVSWFFLIVTHEVPNIFSHEWIYSLPFDAYTPLVFGIGWFFLLIPTVRSMEVARALYEDYRR